MNTLSFIRKQAKKIAQREGYTQVIIRDKDGDYSFSRKYPGCCPAWYGEIVEEVKIDSRDMINAKGGVQ